jgi:prepilin-type N-terminal cleavage/methylation domain-containing protein
MQTRGITLVELLIALAIIGVAFGVLVYAQISHLQATARAGLVSQVKDTATQTLENQVGVVLANFTRFYQGCPTGNESGTGFVCSGPGFIINSGIDEGLLGEGQVMIHASAASQGISITLATRVSCYDSFASRTAAIGSGSLAPCPPIN